MGSMALNFFTDTLFRVMQYLQPADLVRLLFVCSKSAPTLLAMSLRPPPDSGNTTVVAKASAAIHAALSGSLTSVRFLLQWYKLNVNIFYGILVPLSVRSGKVKLLDYLLSRGGHLSSLFSCAAVWAIEEKRVDMLRHC